MIIQKGPSRLSATLHIYRRLRDSGIKVFCVFLTLDGGAANEKDFFRPISYQTLRAILEQNEKKISGEAGQFLRWFADHIQTDLEGNL